MVYGSIGSISWGTMRNEDLMDSFADELERLAKANDRLSEFSELLLDARQTDPEDDSASDVVNDLMDALGEFAAPYCYFGANEGDGSDYGFWPSIDSLEDACRYEDVLNVSDLSEIPADYVGEVMLVNDHGNVTFGTAEKGEFVTIWDCV